jgi:hypothetical protein
MRYISPLDPECPVVAEFMETLFGDPTTSGGDVLFGTFLATHGGDFQFSELDLTGQLINTAGHIQFVSGSTIERVPGPIAGAGLPGLIFARAGTKDFDHFIPRFLVFGGPVRVVQDLDKVAAERCVLHGGYRLSLIMETGAVATAAPPRRRPLGVTNG